MRFSVLLLLKDHICVAPSQRWNTPLYLGFPPFLLLQSGLCCCCSCKPMNPRLNLRFGHCLSLWKLPLYMQMDDLIQARRKLISGFWCGSIKGFMPSGRGPGDSVFKQSEAHMSTTLFWSPLSLWQSHPTHWEQGAQHLLSPF